MSVAVAQPKAVADAAADSQRTGVDTASGQEASTGGDMAQIVSFRLANEEYGVDIMRAQEIIMPGQITRVPEVPDYICGLINLRGHVIPIVDLRKRFGLPEKDNDEHTRIIVVNVASRTIGMVVDAVTEVLRIGTDQIEPPPSSISGIDQDYVCGLIKLEDRLLILLNIEKIVPSEKEADLAQSASASR